MVEGIVYRKDEFIERTLGKALPKMFPNMIDYDIQKKYYEHNNELAEISVAIKIMYDNTILYYQASQKTMHDHLIKSKESMNFLLSRYEKIVKIQEYDEYDLKAFVIEQIVNKTNYKSSEKFNSRQIHPMFEIIEQVQKEFDEREDKQNILQEAISKIELSINK